MSGHLPVAVFAVFAVFLSAPQPSGNTVFSKKLFFRALEPLKKYRKYRKYRKTPQFAVSRCRSLGHRHTDKEGFHFAVAVSAGIEREDFVILPDRIANMREQAPCNRF